MPSPTSGSKENFMAGYRVINKTDKEVWITIYGPLGKMGYGPVGAGKSHDFTSGFWAIGTNYRLLAEYPTPVPHAWTTETTQTLRHTDFDSMHLIGDAKHGYWENP
jgi:hypothetical protein